MTQGFNTSFALEDKNPTFTDVTITGTLDVAGNVSIDGGSFVFNESGGDFDFRIEGDTDAQLFKTDAGTDTVLIGSNANTTDFSAAKMIVSQANSGGVNSGAIGLVAEANASGSGVIGQGLRGVGRSHTADLGIGVFGKAKVYATGDTASAIGIFGLAADTHAGGNNIGVYGNASGGDNNYSFYGAAGGMFCALASIPAHANNAAASAGGIAVGGFYRTNADPSVLCIRSA